jgi:uncharacterized protein YjbI with pentapeptide repeats
VKSIRLPKFLFPRQWLPSFTIPAVGPQTTVLFDSCQAAFDIASMLGGDWDGCNSVFIEQYDEAALNAAASLVGAQWCYWGSSLAVLERLTADRFLQRYAVGERNFANANLRCAVLAGRSSIGVNLSYAKLNWTDLSEADFSQADFTAADLSDANLSRANLSRTCLLKASLTKSDLRLANLKNANMSRACLNGANLSEADLRGANLVLADLRGACLERADLRGANIKDTKVIDSDLVKMSVRL